MDSIKIRDQRYSKSWIENHYESHGHDILSRAYRENIPVYCLCNENTPQKISIRELHPDDATGPHYILARMPRSYSLHHGQCVFRASPDLTGRAQVTSSAIKLVEKTGMIDVALDIKLQQAPKKPQNPSDKVPEPEDEDTKDKPAKAKKQERDAIGLLGLFDLLWSEAALNRWTPPARIPSWVEVQAKLKDAAEPMQVKRKPLAEVLFVPPAFQKESFELHRDLWAQYVATALGRVDNPTRSFGLLIGELKELAPWGSSGKVYALKIKHLPFVTFSLFADTYEALIQHYDWLPDLLNEDTNTTADRAMCVATIGRNAKGYFFIAEIGFQRVTRQWIPSRSSYHSIAINQLVRSGRSIKIPTDYSSGCSSDLPDIELCDCSEPTSLEIFTEQTDDYLIHKSSKLEIMRQSGTTVVEWHPTKQAPFPGLPTTIA